MALEREQQVRLRACGVPRRRSQMRAPSASDPDYDDNRRPAGRTQPGWVPVLTTPAYPSTGATMQCIGASATGILRALFGDENSFTAGKWYLNNRRVTGRARAKLHQLHGARGQEGMSLVRTMERHSLQVRQSVAMYRELRGGRGLHPHDQDAAPGARAELLHISAVPRKPLGLRGCALHGPVCIEIVRGRPYESISLRSPSLRRVNGGRQSSQSPKCSRVHQAVRTLGDCVGLRTNVSTVRVS